MTEESFSKEMGVTHNDFYRLLPRAMGETPYEISGANVNGTLGEGTVSIHLGEPQVRKIALLAIPFAKVSFEFKGVAEEVRSQFMHHFDLHFQRGGG